MVSTHISTLYYFYSYIHIYCGRFTILLYKHHKVLVFDVIMASAVARAPPHYLFWGRFQLVQRLLFLPL